MVVFGWSKDSNWALGSKSGYVYLCFSMKNTFYWNWKEKGNELSNLVEYTLTVRQNKQPIPMSVSSSVFSWETRILKTVTPGPFVFLLKQAIFHMFQFKKTKFLNKKHSQYLRTWI